MTALAVLLEATKLAVGRLGREGANNGMEITSLS